MDLSLYLTRPFSDLLVAELTQLMLEPTGLAAAPVFPVSALNGEGVQALQSHLEGTAEAVAARVPSGNFRLAIDRAFTIQGAGLVVTGTVFSGAVALGDQVMLSPLGLPLRVRGIHAQNRTASQGQVGERLALNIAGANVDKSLVHRGDWILAAPAHAPSRKLDAEIRVLDAEQRVLSNWTPVHVHLGAVDVTGRIAVLEGRSIHPGDSGLAQLVLDREIGAVHGDRLVLRDQTARRTIAGGHVIDSFPPARGRARPQRLAQLKAMRDASAKEALAALLQGAPSGLRLKPFQQAWNLTPEEARALYDAADMVETGEAAEPTGLATPHWQALLDGVVESLDRWHENNTESPGPSPLELRRALPLSVSEPVFTGALEALLGQKAVLRRGTFLHRPSHRAQPTQAEAALWQRVGPILQTGGLRSPRIREIAEELDLELNALEAFLARAQQLGLVLRITKNRCFLPETVSDLASLAEALAGESGDGLFEPRAYRDRSGIGRNLTIEVLEYFDRVGFTRRTSEGRRIVRPAAEIFGQP